MSMLNAFLAEQLKHRLHHPPDMRTLEVLQHLEDENTWLKLQLAKLHQTTLRLENRVEQLEEENFRLRGGEEAAAAKRTAGRRLRDGAEPPGCKPGEAPFHPLPTWLEPHLGSLYTSASDIDANDAGGSGANWRAGGAAGPKPSARGAAEGGLLRAPACVDRFRTDNSQFNNDMTSLVGNYEDLAAAQRAAQQAADKAAARAAAASAKEAAAALSGNRKPPSRQATANKMEPLAAVAAKGGAKKNATGGKAGAKAKAAPGRKRPKSGKLNLKEARLAEDAEGFDGGSGALGCEIAALAAEEEDARNFEQWQYLHDELEALQVKLAAASEKLHDAKQSVAEGGPIEFGPESATDSAHSAAIVALP